MNFENLFAPRGREPTPKERKKIAKWDTRKSGRLIRKAAKIMTDKGQAKHSLQDATGALCVRGAVNYAWCGNPRITSTYVVICGENNPEPILAMKDLAEFLKENGLVPYNECVEHWNDNLSDGEEVIRWMNKFADEVDPQK